MTCSLMKLRTRSSSGATFSEIPKSMMFTSSAVLMGLPVHSTGTLRTASACRL
jgi:hypothetical protein